MLESSPSGCLQAPCCGRGGPLLRAGAAAKAGPAAGGGLSQHAAAAAVLAAESAEQQQAPAGMPWPAGGAAGAAGLWQGGKECVFVCIIPGIPC